MASRVAPADARVHPKLAASAPSLGPFLEHQMKGCTSNAFLRAERRQGEWVQGGQEVLSFDEAYRAACGFAVATLAKGVGPSTRVGIFCTNGIEYTLAILGCHLSGAAAIVREPDMPIGELMMVARATKPQMVLLSPESPAIPDFVAQMAQLPADEQRRVLPWREADEATLQAGGVTLLMRAGAPGGGGDFPGRDGGKAVDGADAFVPPALPADTVALICMTSGTTGTPKGAMHTSAGLAWMCQEVMDPLWYNSATLGARAPGDCLPTLLTFQSGYISGSAGLSDDRLPRHRGCGDASPADDLRRHAGAAELAAHQAMAAHGRARRADAAARRRHEDMEGRVGQARGHAGGLKLALGAATSAPLAVLAHLKALLAPKAKAPLRFLYRKLAAAREAAVRAHHGATCFAKPGGGLWAAIADKTVGKKVRLALGGQCRLIVTGGAKPDEAMLAFFWACGLPVFEGFVSTEVLLAAVNSPQRRWLGTAGPAPPGVEVKLSSDGEICVKSPMGTVGYFEQPEVSAASFDGEGYFKTGDKGEWRAGVDGEEYLAITGRSKDMIILDQRENVWPETLEGIFKRAPLVADCVIPMSCEGDGRQHLLMLVAPAAAGVTDEQLKEQMGAAGRAAGIQAHEYPLQLLRLPEPLTKENGYRNANHKLMRAKIDATWRSEIDAAYAEDASKLDTAWVHFKG